MPAATPPQSIRDVAAAVIQDDAGRFLIVQRGPTAPTFPGHWGVITGLVEVGESPAAAAVREIAEETGLTGRVLRSGEPFTVDIGPYVVRVWPFLCAVDDPAAVRLPRKRRRASQGWDQGYAGSTGRAS